ncbi:DUF4190 domain-containing protein [Virgibacillus flavescens]|uniref:DUF4190 domain-containing protein n=1 Tax=Virgibacillus flavescens TaxID=1611422 RepID=UPI003D3597E0
MNDNNHAVTSLVLGILSIVIPVIGVILGIFGIIYANKSTDETINISDEYRKYAVAGKVCSIVGICVQSIAIFFTVLAFLLFVFSLQLFM